MYPKTKQYDSATLGGVFRDKIPQWLYAASRPARSSGGQNMPQSRRLPIMIFLAIWSVKDATRIVRVHTVRTAKSMNEWLLPGSLDDALAVRK